MWVEIARLFSALGARKNGKDEIAIRLLVSVYGYDCQQSRFTEMGVVESDPVWIVMDGDKNFRISAIMFAEEKTYIRPDARAFGGGAFMLSRPWILLDSGTDAASKAGTSREGEDRPKEDGVKVRPGG